MGVVHWATPFLCDAIGGKRELHSIVSGHLQGNNSLINMSPKNNSQKVAFFCSATPTSCD